MLETRVRLSVVIPCLNVAMTLSQQLEALSKQACSLPWEVVVVDNGSTDGTVAVAKSWRLRLPRLKVVKEMRRGRHHACNAGVGAAEGEFLVFVDGDDEVLPGFLEAMGCALEIHPMVAGRLEHHFPGAVNIEGVGEVQTEGMLDGYGFMPFASGGAMGIQKRVFETVGGFAEDKDFCEDADISWRVQLAGYPVAFVPEAGVSIRQRFTTDAMYRQHRNFGETRVLLFRDYFKHGMPRRGWREVGASWLMLVKSLPFLGDSSVRARWVRRLGRNVGFIRGSVKYKMLYL